ncbi:MAG: TetR/AcrR family transcriptional regulator, partial [Eubacterium sp.]
TLGDLSKGAIYHHFKSKDEIINTLLDKVNIEFNPFALGFDDGICRTGLEKIRFAFIQSLKDKKSIVLYHAAPYLLKNPKFLSKQFELTFSASAPSIRTFIEEGITDGSITCDNPSALSEIFCLITNIWINPSALPVNKSSFLAKVSFAKELFDGVGFPLIDDTVMSAVEEYAD